VARHVDVAAEAVVLCIECGKLAALGGRQQRLDDGAAVAIERSRKRCPVGAIEAAFGVERVGRGAERGAGFAQAASWSGVRILQPRRRRSHPFPAAGTLDARRGAARDCFRSNRSG
jgi:hypothetical protein